jgi:hypothetical protein
MPNFSSRKWGSIFGTLLKSPITIVFAHSSDAAQQVDECLHSVCFAAAPSV